MAKVRGLEGTNAGRITLTIGGRECQDLEVITPDPDSPDASCSLTFAGPCEKRLKCTTPPGVGSRNEVIVNVGSGGTVEAASRGNWMILSYRAPVVEAAFA